MKILYGLLFHHHFYNSFNCFKDLIYELSMVSVKFLYLPFSVTMTKAFVFSLLRPQVYQSCSEGLPSYNSPSFLLTKDTSINIQTFAERHQNAFKMYNTHQAFNKCFYISTMFIYLSLSLVRRDFACSWVTPTRVSPFMYISLSPLLSLRSWNRRVEPSVFVWFSM